MPIFDVDVTTMTAGGTTAADFLAALETAFNNSTKFTVEGSDANGFWISCNKAGEGWELALSDDSGAIDIAIDPNATFTSSTTVSDTSAWSGVQLAVDFDATNSTTFYLVELPDAFFVLWVNASTSDLSEAMHAGRIFGGTRWDFPDTGLGWVADEANEGSAITDWIYTGFSTGTRNYGQLWGDWYRMWSDGGPAYRGEINGNRVPYLYGANFIDVQGSTDAQAQCHYLYMFDSISNGEPPGDMEVSANDVFIYLHNGSAVSPLLIPWDSAANVPIFA